MTAKKILFLAVALLIAAFVMTACAGPEGAQGPAGPAGPAGPQGPAGADGMAPAAADLTCTNCHNDTTLLEGKSYAWEMSKHGTENEDWMAEGSQQACSGCHSGAGFIARVAAGQNFIDWGAAKVTTPDATPITCRTCHTIHTTYTADDFALRTTTAVALVKGGVTFDKGMGNLCVNCHQARRYMADFPAKDAAGAVIANTYAVTIRFNPHLSGQSDMLMGVGGGGTVVGTPAAHYTMTTDSCVTCHLGSSANHTFTASVTACVACHADAKSTDVNGAVSAFQAKYDALTAELLKANLIADNGDGTYSPVANKTLADDKGFASALWAWGYIAEDGSMGVHNMKYANALVDAAMASLTAK